MHFKINEQDLELIFCVILSRITVIFVQILSVMIIKNFMFSWVEHGKRFNNHNTSPDTGLMDSSLSVAKINLWRKTLSICLNCIYFLVKFSDYSSFCDMPVCPGLEIFGCIVLPFRTETDFKVLVNCLESLSLNRKNETS